MNGTKQRTSYGMSLARVVNNELTRATTISQGTTTIAAVLPPSGRLNERAVS